MLAPLIKVSSFYFWLVIGALLISVKVTADGNGELVYYVTCLVLAVFFASLSRFPKSKTVGLFWLFLSFLVLFIMYGFRDISGIDDRVYEKIFYFVLHEGWLQRFLLTTMEPGYLLVNQLFGLFVGDYIYFQVFISFISLFLFYKAFHDNKDIGNIEVAIFFLFCMLMMQMQSVALVRMFLAMSIVAVSFKYLVNGVPRKYIFYVLIASMFHYSAFFLLFLVYFSYNKKAFGHRLFFYYILLALAFPFIMIFVVKFLLPVLGARYHGYANSEFSLDFTTLNTLPMIFVLAYFYNEKFKLDDVLVSFRSGYYKILLFVYSLSLLIFIFGSIASLGRLVFYSYVAFIILTPIMLRSIRRPALYFMVSGVFVLYGYLYIYRTQFINEHHLPHLIPVQNILF